MFKPLSIYRFFNAKTTPLLRLVLSIVVILYVGAFIFQPSITVAKKIQNSEAFVFVRESDTALDDQLKLFNSEAIFLPTEQNTYSIQHAVMSGDIDADVPEFSVEPILAQTMTPLQGDDPIADTVVFTPATSRDALGISHWNPAGNINRIAPSPVPFRPYLRIENFDTAAEIFSGTVPLEFDEKFADPLPRPVIFSFAIDAQGALAAPVLMRFQDAPAGSGTAEIDAVLRSFVEKKSREIHLPPGRYRFIFSL